MVCGTVLEMINSVWDSSRDDIYGVWDSSRDDIRCVGQF